MHRANIFYLAFPNFSPPSVGIIPCFAGGYQKARGCFQISAITRAGFYFLNYFHVAICAYFGSGEFLKSAGGNKKKAR